MCSGLLHSLEWPCPFGPVFPVGQQEGKGCFPNLIRKPQSGGQHHAWKEMGESEWHQGLCKSVAVNPSEKQLKQV